jgi:hypothetical protein
MRRDSTHNTAKRVFKPCHLEGWQGILKGYVQRDIDNYHVGVFIDSHIS